MNSDEPPPQHNVAAVILAAGLGTRMRSRTPKELQPLAGRRLIDYVLQAVGAAHPAQIIIVLSPAKAQMVESLPEGCEVAWQHEPLGTGHALAQAMSRLRPEIDQVAVFFGDHPLLSADVARRLVEASAASGALVTLLTTVLPEPGAYGRLRWDGERITGVVEAKEDTTVYTAPVEVNSGMSCYRRDWLERELLNIPKSAVGEYYLTSLVERAAEESAPARPVISVVAPRDVAFGVNDRVELARAENVLRQRINERLMRSGVAIVDPKSTFIDDTVEIGQDTRIEPFTTISGRTVIGEDCRIGPQAIIRDSQIGNAVVITASMIESAVIGDRVDVGPYAHLRPGARIGDGAHIGNYAEIKNSALGPGTHVGHFSYIGDADVGSQVNIGAGTITCNYDGTKKHRTIIGSGAFIGSDTMLVAPVEIGSGARTGAGSVVTRDVAPDETVVGVPARPVTK
ncbi:bifunctional UDP-N-acetylglucosamine diphosphorylase/glucosamine-1-phosphate N-acetyltransferase GlmU [Nitrolancea hollandica]|uniref:bifunctional UDP-N-acetylglucosamine diphosphorylase/glucosamine-1-phosphate N-acetyltransferase GlmU n=1 Tax=Nitrolancea hollandica TaxID=1206749 RepID=UPI000316314B|nr:bifunctional UDP-N-acetylglucosamine diphosphorylase/glucosamine-1-phosphate N-acetyltransferase GlmU [Nitrolancea hollandica]